MDRCSSMRLAVIGVLIGGLMPVMGFAKSPDRVNEPAAATSKDNAAAEPLILTDVDFNAVPLSDALQFMREKNPRFIYTLIRDAQVPPTFPAITLKTKSLEYGQFLRLIATTYPTVEVTEVPEVVPGASGVAYSIRICNVADIQPPVVKVYSIPDVPDPDANTSGGGAMGNTESAATSKLRAAMDKTIPELKVESAPLDDVVQLLRDVTGSNIVADWVAMEQAGLDRKTPVSIKLRDVKFAKVLQTILDSVSTDPNNQLTFIADEGVITISTSQRLAQQAQARPRSLAPVLSLIEAAVAQVPSLEKAVLKVHEATGTLIVKGTQDQQDAVREALNALAAGQQTGGLFGGSTANRTAPRTHRPAAQTQPAQSR